jgi:hypothetical protein
LVVSIPGTKDTHPSRGIDFRKSCDHHSAPADRKLSCQYCYDHTTLSKGITLIHSASPKKNLYTLNWQRKTEIIDTFTTDLIIMKAYKRLTQMIPAQEKNQMIPVKKVKKWLK